MTRRRRTQRTKQTCISRNKAACLFLAPSLAGTAVFTLIPFLDVIAKAFTGMADGKFAGLGNFILVVNNGAFRLAARNTLRFMAVCIPLLMAVSLGTAVLVKAAADSTGLFKTTVLLPMAVPVASVVYLWKMVFHSQGLLNQLLGHTGGAAIDFMQHGSAFFVLIFTYIWKNNGYDMVLWLAGLDGISGELYEAAQVDGAGALQKFCYITVPGLRGTASLVALLSVINSFKVFREAYLIAGDYPHDSIYMLQHLFNNWFVSLDIQKMSAASVLLELAVLSLVVLWNWRRRGHD